MSQIKKDHLQFAVSITITILLVLCLTLQSISQNIPAKIKIDGKVTEWNKQDQRYNKNTSLYYTIANDDTNLYLTVTAIDKTVMRKAILGGVMLTVSNIADKKFKDASAVTFPQNERGAPFIMDLNGVPNNRYKDEPFYDSVMLAYNKQLDNKVKTIGIAGIKVIADTLISIYNEEGIKAAVRFDNKLHYNLELAIPIKYLNLAANSAKINFNIKLPGATNTNIGKVPGRDFFYFKGADGVNYSLGEGTPQNMDLMSPTNFGGEYVLVKN